MQVGVLRWIGDGCLEGVVSDEVSARISAAALRNRATAEVPLLKGRC
jgi:hypothetical protein